MVIFDGRCVCLVGPTSVGFKLYCKSPDRLRTEGATHAGDGKLEATWTSGELSRDRFERGIDTSAYVENVRMRQINLTHSTRGQL